MTNHAAGEQPEPPTEEAARQPESAPRDSAEQPQPAPSQMHAQPPQAGGHPGYGGYPGAPPVQPYGPYMASTQTGPTQDDKTMAMLTYLLAILVGWLGPLIMFCIKKDRSRFVRYHAAQALNHAITSFFEILIVLVVVLAVAIPSGMADVPAGVAIGVAVGVVSYLTIWIAGLVCNILGCIRANRGEWYRQPTWICWRMIK